MKMKRKTTFWGIFLVGMSATCLIISLKISHLRYMNVPEKIVPAAVRMSPAQHRLPEIQERDWLRTGLRVLQRRLDSLVADSIKQSNH